MSVINIKDIQIQNVTNSMSLFISNMQDKATNDMHNSWGSDVWVIKKQKIKFTKLSEKHFHNEKMNSDFIDFAKAYITHEYPFESNRLGVVIATLRCVEYILLKTHGCANMCIVNYCILEEIISFIKNRYSNNYAYVIGRELKGICSFLFKNKLTYKNIAGWKNPIRFKQDYFLDDKEKHNKKIPNEEIIYIFADIFSQELTDKRDIFTTSVVALLMSAPSRISEVLSLSIDCVFTNTTQKGNEKWGLRFWAGKGYGGDIKWIPSVMAPVTQKAIDRVRRLTNKPRMFAKLMELNFEAFHKQTKFSRYSESELLTTVQVCEVLLNESISEKEGIKLLKRLSIKSHDNIYSLRTLWQELQSRLPEGFPWYNKKKNIKFSDLLFLFFKDSLHLNKSDNIIELYTPHTSSFYSDTYYQEKRKNIFERHEYQNGNKQSFHFHSHQIRHLLNTIAQRKGMTEYEVAKWSGRASIKQNRVYNHVSEEEIIEKFESLKRSSTNYTVSENITVRNPVSRESFLSVSHGAVHKTEFGYCIHDYAISPCEKFRDCLNCSEQICIKGSLDSLTRLKERLSETNELIETTRKYTNENDRQIDKDRWLNFHLKIKERLQELISILESKEIPEGSFVRLSNKSYSHLSRTYNAEKLLNNKKEIIHVKKIN